MPQHFNNSNCGFWLNTFVLRFLQFYVADCQNLQQQQQWMRLLLMMTVIYHISYLDVRKTGITTMLTMVANFILITAATVYSIAAF